MAARPKWREAAQEEDRDEAGKCSALTRANRLELAQHDRRRVVGFLEDHFVFVNGFFLGEADKLHESYIWDIYSLLTNGPFGDKLWQHKRARCCLGLTCAGK